MTRLKWPRSARLFAAALLVATCLLVTPIRANNHRHGMAQRAVVPCDMDQKDCNGVCIPWDKTCGPIEHCRFDQRECNGVCIPVEQPCGIVAECNMDQRECNGVCIPLGESCAPLTLCRYDEKLCGEKCIPLDQPCCRSDEKVCGNRCIATSDACTFGSNTLCETISPMIFTTTPNYDFITPYVSRVQLLP